MRSRIMHHYSGDGALRTACGIQTGRTIATTSGFDGVTCLRCRSVTPKLYKPRIVDGGAQARREATLSVKSMSARELGELEKHARAILHAVQMERTRREVDKLGVKYYVSKKDA